jgi:hypothetical protein
MIPSVSQYAGQQLLTSPQAKVYANDFIAVRLSELPFSGLYSKISVAALAAPHNAKLQRGSAGCVSQRTDRPSGIGWRSPPTDSSTAWNQGAAIATRPRSV